MLADCLRSVRVLDLSQYLPGPYATQILADLGAEVIKVEPPTGDAMRRLGPRDADGVSPVYKFVNAGKEVLHLDLKSDGGRAGFTELIARADALLESFRPGVVARLGFGPEAAGKLNPRLVYCSLTGYGQSGPYGEKGGHDVNYVALSGGLSTSGTPERPVMAHPPTADFASGMQAALATLAALLRRERTGEGAFLDVSIAETVLAWQAMVLTAASRPGQEPGRAQTLLNGGLACYQIYETADGRFVTLGALEEKFWANFCSAVSREDWTGRQWEPMPQAALIRDVAGLFKSRTSQDWGALLADVDCCFQLVLEPCEVPAHPQVAARGLVRTREGSEPLVETLFPALMDGLPPEPRTPFREVTLEEALQAWPER